MQVCIMSLFARTDDYHMHVCTRFRISICASSRKPTILSRMLKSVKCFTLWGLYSFHMCIRILTVSRLIRFTKHSFQSGNVFSYYTLQLHSHKQSVLSSMNVLQQLKFSEQRNNKWLCGGNISKFHQHRAHKPIQFYLSSTRIRLKYGTFVMISINIGEN